MYYVNNTLTHSLTHTHTHTHTQYYINYAYIIRVDTRNPYPLIKKIFPDGSAAECALMAVEDALLEVLSLLALLVQKYKMLTDCRGSRWTASTASTKL